MCFGCGNQRLHAVLTLLLPPLATALFMCPQFCKAVQWELYCSAKSSVSKIARGLITGFLPSLLITLWQVRRTAAQLPICKAFCTCRPVMCCGVQL